MRNMEPLKQKSTKYLGIKRDIANQALIKFNMKTYVILSFLQTNTDKFENSTDPDETAHNGPSHQDLHYLPLFY